MKRVLSELLDWSVPIAFGLIFILYFIAIVVVIKAGFTQRKCTDAELNIVIDQVQLCKKKNVICPEKEIDRLIKEICGK